MNVESAMPPQTKQGLLLKISKRIYIEKFLNGEVFMRPLAEFVHLFEGDEARADDYEGVGTLVRAEGGLLNIWDEGQWKPIGHLSGPMRHRPENALNVNAFCMHILAPREDPNLVDPANFAFGDTFALVTNMDEFLRRVHVSAAATGQELLHGPVTYIDETAHNGAMGPFRKRLRFQYQNEFRIALLPGTGQPFTLEIGDISDIVMVGPVADLNQKFRFFNP
jgi:hypothetical protein